MPIYSDLEGQKLLGIVCWLGAIGQSLEKKKKKYNIKDMSERDLSKGKRYVQIPPGIGLNELARQAKSKPDVFFSPGSMSDYARKYGPQSLIAAGILLKTLQWIFAR